MRKEKDGKSELAKEAVTTEAILLQEHSLKKLTSVMAIICALVGFLLYGNTLGHNYTIDDDTVIQKNSIVTKGVSAWPEIFTTPYRKGFWDRQEAMYRPMSLAMFSAEWQIAPGKPFVGHLVNVLIYALTGFILLYTLRKLLNGYSVIVPFIATLLFIAHPLHTEVVANIKSRDELLSLLFLTVSLNFLFKYFIANEKKAGSLILSSGSFLLALLSKESAITFLAVFPLTLYFFSEFDLKKIAKISTIFIIPVAIYFILRANALSEVSGTLEIQAINNSLVSANGTGERLATAITVLGRYLSLLVFPHPLVFDYSFNQIPNVGFGNISAIVSSGVLLVLLFYAIWTIKKKSVFSFCIIYYLITISIVSNLLFLIESVMAERFLYIPSLGFCIGLAILLVKVFKIRVTNLKIYNFKSVFIQARTAMILLMIILFFYSVKTISRNADWKSNLILLKHDVKSSPKSARIRYALGAELLLKGAMKEKDSFKKAVLLDESIAQLQKGVEILPSYSDAFYDLGLAYTEKGDGINAVNSFESAKRTKNWNEAEFFVSSGIAFGLAKQYENAFADFTRAISISDTIKGAFNNWGAYLNEAGKPKEAMEKLKKATDLDSNYAAAWYNLGNSYALSGEFEKAIPIYEKVIAIDPQHIDALTNIGNCNAAMGRISESIKWYEKVLAIDPTNFKATQNLKTSGANLRK